LTGSTISFNFPNGYDTSLELYIDPELIFSTYSGSFSDNFGYTATYDTEGYLYSGSSAFGNDYPVTTGAYQETWAGGDGQGTLPGIDMALSKYDVTGTFMVWSSYLGGSHDELPHSLICDENNTLYVYGTTSSPDFPVTTNAYDNSWNGGSIFAPSGVGADYVNGSDIVVAHFNTSGSNLLSSTFLGGSGNDGVNTAANLKFNYADEFRGEIDIDNEGNIIIATSTYSADFPMVNAEQPLLNGVQEACLIKLNSDLSDILWSTYVGGSSDDAGNSVAFDSNNNIYFCGGTKSNDFPGMTSGLQSTYAGGNGDGWVVLISENGSQFLAGTYYGSNQYDQFYFVETDSDDFVHVYGQTMADDDFFIFNAGYNEPNSGMLVSKFSSDLDELIWSTVFGTGEGEPNLSPTALLVDVCGKIYLAGWGGSTNTSSNPNTDNVTGMETTPGAYQTTTNGSDFYFMVLEADASELVYASFFGGATSNEHVDGGTSRFDRKGIMYQSVCAGCGSNDDFPIFPADAWSPTNNSSNCNNGVFKFDFELPLVAADFLVPPVACMNGPVAFTNTSTNGLTFFWDFGDDQTSNIPEPFHQYTETGTYIIMLVVNNPGTCNFTDTLYKEIEIVMPSVSTLESEQVCSDNVIQLGPEDSNTNYEYTWFPSLYLSDINDPNPTFTPGISTDYYCLVEHGGCVDTIYQSVLVTALELTVPEDTTLCLSGTVVLNANYSPLAGDLIWSDESDFGNVLNDGPDDSDIEVVITEPTTFYAQLEVNGCVVEASVTINLVSFQTMIGGDFAACDGDTVNIFVLDPNPDFVYQWAPANLIVSGQNTPNVEVAVEGPTVIEVTSVTPFNCSFTDEVLISISTLDPSAVNASVNPDLIIDGMTVQLDASPDGFEYTWTPTNGVSSPNVQSPTASPSQTTTYCVTISDDECAYEDCVTVRVEDFVCGPPTIYIPNAFTPNTDDKNEKLYVRGNFITELYFVVYDRWGEKVFETKDINKGWDGTFKGKIVDPDVYVYYLEATCDGGLQYFDKGNITVIR
jgi:gliding motility-associated-like protein